MKTRDSQTTSSKNYIPHEGCTTNYLGVYIQSNGAKQYALWCNCRPYENRQHPKRGDWISYDTMTEFARRRNLDVSKLPIVIDNSPNCCGGEGCEICQRDRCARCGSRKRLEWHHWAPRALFRDCDDWPTAMLCRECHTRWHQLVTPNMRRTEDT